MSLTRANYHNHVARLSTQVKQFGQDMKRTRTNNSGGRGVPVSDHHWLPRVHLCLLFLTVDPKMQREMCGKTKGLCNSCWYSCFISCSSSFVSFVVTVCLFICLLIGLPLFVCLVACLFVVCLVACCLFGLLLFAAFCCFMMLLF